MIRIYEMEVPDDTDSEAIENAIDWDNFDEEESLMGEYIYPAGQPTREVLEEIEELL